MYNSTYYQLNKKINVQNLVIISIAWTQNVEPPIDDIFGIFATGFVIILCQWKQYWFGERQIILMFLLTLLINLYFCNKVFFCDFFLM